MRFLLLRRRRRLKQAVSLERGRRNPYFPGPAEQGRGAWRFRFLVGEIGLTTLLIGYVLFFSPLFLIDDIDVSTNESSLPTFEATVEEILNKRRALGILPVRNYLVLKPGWMRDRLVEVFASSVTFERIRVTKVFPNALRFEAVERGAIALWRNSTGLYGLDETGVAIRRYRDDEQLPELVMLFDENDVAVNVGSTVIQPEIVRIAERLRSEIPQLGLQSESILIPKFSCPEPRLPQPSTNTNSEEGERNVQVNANSSNANAASAQPESNEPEPCDLASLVRFTREFHVQLKDGPRLMFVSENLDNQLEKLRRAIQDAKIDLTKLSYIDIRFGDRVYYQ